MEAAAEVMPGPRHVDEMPIPYPVAGAMLLEAPAEDFNRPRAVQREDHRFPDPEQSDEDESDDDLDLVDNQPVYEFLDPGHEGDFTDDEEIGPDDMYDPPDLVEDYNEVHFDEAAKQDVHYDEEIMSEGAGYSDSGGDEEPVDIGVEYSEGAQLEGVYDNLDEDEGGSTHSLYDDEASGNHEIGYSDLRPEDDVVIFERFSQQEDFAQAGAEELHCYEDAVETGVCEVEESEDDGEQGLDEEADDEHNDSEEPDDNEPDGYLESNDRGSDMLNYYDEPDQYGADYYDGPDLDHYDEPDHYANDSDHYDGDYDDEPTYYYDQYD